MAKQDPIRSILDSLRRLVRELRLASRRVQARFGLTAAQLFVLERVALRQPLSINELADLTLTHQSSVSVVARRLVELGFLEQRPAPQDRRRKELTMTARGRKALRRVPASVQDRLLAGLAAMQAAERETLAALLRTLTGAIGLQNAEPVLFFEKEHPAGRRRRRRKNPVSPGPRKAP